MNSQNNTNIVPDKSENKKIIITQALEDLVNCAECKNFNEYEREEELIKIIFKYSNILYND